MATKTGKTTRKPTSRGQRKHVRRVKQEARRAGLPEQPLKGTTRSPEVRKE